MAVVFLMLAVLILLLVLLLVQMLLAESELNLMNQMSSVESGYEKVWHSALLSSPFFFLASLYVLFDMELVLLMPGIFYNLDYKSSQVLMMIIFIVTVTLMLEWSFSGLKWQI